MLTFVYEGECKLIITPEPMTQDEVNEMTKDRWKLKAALQWNGSFYFYFVFELDG